MENNNYVIETGSRKVNRIEELEGCYYTIPEYVYYRIPVKYKVGGKFTPKKFPIAFISLLFFSLIIKYLSGVNFEITACCAMFPLLLIALAVFLNAVLPKDPFVTKDSQIIEAEVKDVEIRRSGRYTLHIAALYIPSVDKTVKVYFGQPVSEGEYAVIVRQKNTLTFIRMHDNYVPEYNSGNR